jgi:hypothetical protein
LKGGSITNLVEKALINYLPEETIINKQGIETTAIFLSGQL